MGNARQPEGGSVLPYFDDLPRVLGENARTLPNISAIYFVCAKPDIVIYIGETKALKNRWYEHPWRPQFLQAGKLYIAWLPAAPESRKIIEEAAIRRLAPPGNTKGKGFGKDLRFKSFIRKARKAMA